MNKNGNIFSLYTPVEIGWRRSYSVHYVIVNLEFLPAKCFSPSIIHFNSVQFSIIFDFFLFQLSSTVSGRFIESRCAGSEADPKKIVLIESL